MNALVYGGRSPIALEICKQLAEAGHKVHLVTRVRDEAIVALAKENGCSEVHECNLEDSDIAIALALKIDKQVSGLEAVAFVHRYRSAVSNPSKEYSVDVYTPYEILEALASQHRDHECAVMITTSPSARSIVGDQNFQYHASKAALPQLVRFGAVRFASRNIRVNGLSPGSFVFKQRAAEFYAKNPQITDRANNMIPMGRMATVGDIANAALFLLTKQSGYINGHILEADGGLSGIDPASLSKEI